MDQSSNPLPHDTGDCSLIDSQECLIRVDRLRSFEGKRPHYLADIFLVLLDYNLKDSCAVLVGERLRARRDESGGTVLPDGVRLEGPASVLLSDLVHHATVDNQGSDCGGCCSFFLYSGWVRCARRS